MLTLLFIYLVDYVIRRSEKLRLQIKREDFLPNNTGKIVVFGDNVKIITETEENDFLETSFNVVDKQHKNYDTKYPWHFFFFFFLRSPM